MAWRAVASLGCSFINSRTNHNLQMNFLNFPLKIYKELNCQNGIIFDAERERDELELERDSLKGFEL